MKIAWGNVNCIGQESTSGINIHKIGYNKKIGIVWPHAHVSRKYCILTLSEYCQALMHWPHHTQYSLRSNLLFLISLLATTCKKSSLISYTYDIENILARREILEENNMPKLIALCDNHMTEGQTLPRAHASFQM